MLDRREYLLQPSRHPGHIYRTGTAFDVTSSQKFGSGSRMAVIRIMSLTARMSLAVLVSLVANTRAWAQFMDDPHDANQPQGYSSLGLRSEERRVGKECRCRWAP